MTPEYFWEVEQRSPEWFDMRRGVLTASNAGKLVTPGGKISTQWRGEMGRLIAESLRLQEPEGDFTSEWMQQGIDMESEAVSAFEFITGMQTAPCGFVKLNRVGFSPDALVEWDGFYSVPLQVKCPKPSTHIEWLLAGGGLPEKHWPQVYFEMAVAGADRAFFMSYCRDMNPLIVCVHRDPDTMPESGDTLLAHAYFPGRLQLMQQAMAEFEKTYIETHDKVTGGEL